MFFVDILCSTKLTLFKIDVIFVYKTFSRKYLLDCDGLGKFVLKTSVYLTFEELIILILTKKSLQLLLVLEIDYAD